MINNRYYYQTTGIMRDTCTEPCQIKKPIHIGSAKCQQCDSCISHNADEGWIECNKIALATGVLKD